MRFLELGAHPQPHNLGLPCLRSVKHNCVGDLCEKWGRPVLRSQWVDTTPTLVHTCSLTDSCNADDLEALCR